MCVWERERCKDIEKGLEKYINFPWEVEIDGGGSHVLHCGRLYLLKVIYEMT